MDNIQGVVPAYDLDFNIGTKGRNSTEEEMLIIKDVESLSPSIDGGVEEWNPMDQHGWVRRLMTSKSFSLSISGKRHYGDPGNDYVAGLSFKSGQNVNTVFEIGFPNKDTLKFNCVVNVTTPFGGDSTSPNSLDFEVLSDGEPIYTEFKATE